MVARSGDGWSLAPCLGVLFDQLDEFDGSRPKAADGTIGDARHQAESYSDHNPRLADNGVWYVTAGDVTTDTWTDAWVREVLVTDTRVKYLIWRGQYWQRINWDGGSTFEWRAYHGTDPHTGHVHISVQLDAATDKRPWGMPEEETVDQAQEDRIVKRTVDGTIAALRRGDVLKDVGTLRDRTIVPMLTQILAAIKSLTGGTKE